jgi:hypothetical protein
VLEGEGGKGEGQLQETEKRGKGEGAAPTIITTTFFLQHTLVVHENTAIRDSRAGACPQRFRFAFGFF